MRKILLVITLLVFSGTVWGQWTYTPNFYPATGNPGNVNTEGDAPGLGSWTVLVPGPQSANIWSPITPIPFAFDFYGQPVTHFKISQNGVLTFDTMAVALPDNQNRNLPTATGLPNQSIAGFWDSFTTSAPTGSGDDIRINTFGTAPNRQFWIKYYSFEIGSPVASFRYWAIVLEETSNKIYLVDQYSTTTAVSTTAGLQLNPTTGVQWADSTFDLSGNGTSTTDNDYVEFTPVFLTPNDAGITQILSPGIGSPGTYPVTVEIKNFGTNNLTSATINWDWNGVAQTPFSWTGNLPNNGLDTVTLGSLTLNSLDTICAWTSLPNGAADGLPANDTTCIYWCPGLAGNYTVGGVGADYPSITEAAAACYQCGLASSVEFTINPGTYLDSLILPPIPGSGPAATLTFNGVDRSLVTMTHGGVQEALVDVIGADYLTFKNMTFENTRTVDSWGVLLRDTADYITVDSCRFIMSTTGTSDIVAIAGTGSTTSASTLGNNANHGVFTNNIIEGGVYGMRISGLGTALFYANDFEIANNDISGFTTAGIYLDNIDTLTILDNHIYNGTGAASDGIYCFDLHNFEISRNQVYVPDYGLYISASNVNYPVIGRSRISGNMISSSADYGTYLFNSNMIDIFQNSFYSGGNYGLYLNDLVSLNIRNNIMMSDASYAFYTADLLSLGGGNDMNYNIYWTPPSNLNYVREGANIYADLPAWQTGNPLVNANSYERDPLFVLPLSDLHVVGINANDIGDNAASDPFDLDGDARPLSPSVTVDIGADEYTPLAFDAEFGEMVSPVIYGCGDSLTVVSVSFRNLGSTPITSATLKVNVGPPYSTQLTQTYSGALTFGQLDTVIVGTINTSLGGSNITFDAWVELAGDQNMSNDTMAPTFTQSFVPSIPQGIDNSVCGVDSGLIFGVPYGGVIYEWFTSDTASTPVGVGNSFMVPSISTQSTYWVGYAPPVSDSIQTTFAGGNSCGGGNMFDVTATTGIAISGIWVNSTIAAGSPITVVIHTIPNGTYVGNETSPGAWTTHGTFAAVSNGSGNPTYVSFAGNFLNLQPGTAGMYVETAVSYTNGSFTYTSGAITITTGVGLCNSFGGINDPRSWNGALEYQVINCSGARTPVTIVSNPYPVISLGADSTLCDTALSFNIGNFPSILWSDGSTGSNFTATSTGQYDVAVTDANGCMAYDTVNVTLNTPVVVDLGPDQNLCAPATAMLDAGNPGVSYAWSTGDVTQTISVNTSGTYSVLATDTTGCAGSDSVTINIDSAPVGAFTQSQSGSGLSWNFTDASSNNPTSWAWDFGDGSGTSSSQNPSYTYSSDGNYIVTLIVTNACGSDTFTVPISVLNAGAALGLGGVSAYPNPNNGSFTLEFSNVNATDVQVEVYDFRGKQISNSQVGSVNGYRAEKVDLSGVAAGVYFLNVRADGQQATLRITVE